MFKPIRKLVYPRLLFTPWNVGTRGTEFMWKRYNRESDAWEIKEVTPNEREEAFPWWAVK